MDAAVQSDLAKTGCVFGSAALLFAPGGVAGDLWLAHAVDHEITRRRRVSR